MQNFSNLKHSEIIFLNKDGKDFYLNLLDYTEIFIITDHNLKNLYLETVLDQLKKNIPNLKLNFYSILPNDQSKNLDLYHQIILKLSQHHFSRKTLILSLGGGVVMDLAGFVAATYLRGVNLIHMPTTLLGMVDASIGGKCGLNNEYGKNRIGAFYLPQKILIHIDFLNSLDLRNYYAGFAEIIKKALIADENLFNFIESNINQIKQKDFKKDLNNLSLKHIIERACKIKQNIILKDPKESLGQSSDKFSDKFSNKSGRVLLNFGHTLGHAIEKSLNYNSESILHGEAVAIGILFALKLSEKKYNLSETIYNRVKKIFIDLNYFNYLNKLNKIDNKILNLFKYDKKAIDHKLKFILISQCGVGVVEEFDLEDSKVILLFKECLNELY